MDAYVIVATKDEQGNIIEKYYDFDKDTDVSDLLSYATMGIGFRIIYEEYRNLWNDILDREWSGLDDGDYYHYERPYVHLDKWYTEVDGVFKLLTPAINCYEERTQDLKALRNLYGGRY